MISLMSRILAIAGKYRRNIKIAFIFSFLKSMLAKSPIGLAFIAFNAFYIIKCLIDYVFCLVLH